MKLEPAISGSAKLLDESARLFQCLTVGERDLNQVEDISPATFFALLHRRSTKLTRRGKQKNHESLRLLCCDITGSILTN